MRLGDRFLNLSPPPKWKSYFGLIPKHRPLCEILIQVRTRLNRFFFI